MVTTYTQLCPVVFGAGSIQELSNRAKSFGGQRALCVYDTGVKMSGISDKVMKILNDAGIETFIFDQVLPDAPDEMINEAGQYAKENRVEMVVGIGGGSSMDTAKAVTVLVDNPLPVNQYYASKGGTFISKTPLILIPTASGTGSEVTIMGVIHDHELHSKEAVLRPANLAIVDPELTLTVPPYVTAATGMDALSHAIESYTTNCGNPKSDILSLSAVELIHNNLEMAYQDGGNINARTNMSLASNLAGMAFNDASVHFGHCIAHEFGIQFNMPHGVACALTLPEVILFSADIIPEKTAMIAKAMGVELPENATGLQAGELVAEEVRKLMKTVGIKSLKEQGISRETAIACAEEAVTKNWFIVCALKSIDNKVMSELIGKVYDNYQ